MRRHTSKKLLVKQRRPARSVRRLFEDEEELEDIALCGATSDDDVVP